MVVHRIHRSAPGAHGEPPRTSSHVIAGMYVGGDSLLRHQMIMI
jgi:hypothetical protein